VKRSLTGAAACTRRPTGCRAAELRWHVLLIVMLLLLLLLLLWVTVVLLLLLQLLLLLLPPSLLFLPPTLGQVLIGLDCRLEWISRKSQLLLLLLLLLLLKLVLTTNRLLFPCSLSNSLLSLLLAFDCRFLVGKQPLPQNLLPHASWFRLIWFFSCLFPLPRFHNLPFCDGGTPRPEHSLSSPWENQFFVQRRDRRSCHIIPT